MNRIRLTLTIVALFGIGLRVSAQSLQERRTLKPAAQVIALTFSGDGKTLVTAGEDKTVTFWNAVTGEEVRTLKDLTSPITSLSMSRDGRTLAGVSADKTVTLWDAASGKVKDTLKDIGGLIALTADGKGLAYLRHGKTEKQNWTKVYLLDLAAKKENVLITYSEPEFIPDSTDHGTCLAFSADGKTLAVGSAFPLAGNTNAVTCYDLASGKEGTWKATLRKSIQLPGRLGQGGCLAFRDDNKTLLAAGAAHLSLLDTVSGKEKLGMKGNDSALLTISADGNSLASVGPEKTVKIWTISAGKDKKN